MARYSHPDVLDAALNVLRNNATRYIVCAGQPANYAAAVGANKLGEAVVDSSDFTLANGDVSGRKVTVAGQSGNVDASGTADHVALVDEANSRLLYVTVLSASQAFTSGNTWNTQAFDIEIEAPAAP